jgi:inosine-uridine nucleoside N-ribohydrolase
MAGVEGVHVVPGAARPLLRAPRVCSEIHGASGLDGPDLACCDTPQPPPCEEKAVHRMHAALCAALSAGCAR